VEYNYVQTHGLQVGWATELVRIHVCLLLEGHVLGCVLNSCSSWSYSLIKRDVLLLIHSVAEVTAKNKEKRAWKEIR